MGFAGPTGIAIAELAKAGAKFTAEFIEDKAKEKIKNTNKSTDNGNVKDMPELTENNNGTDTEENGTENGQNEPNNGINNLEQTNGTMGPVKSTGKEGDSEKNKKQILEKDKKNKKDNNKGKLIEKNIGGPGTGPKTTAIYGKCSKMHEVAIEILEKCEECKDYKKGEIEKFKTFEELQKHLFETYEKHTSSFFEIIDPKDDNDNYKKVKGRIHFMKCKNENGEEYSTYISEETLDKDHKFGHLKIPHFDKYKHIFHFKDYSILDLESPNYENNSQNTGQDEHLKIGRPHV